MSIFDTLSGNQEMKNLCMDFEIILNVVNCCSSQTDCLDISYQVIASKLNIKKKDSQEQSMKSSLARSVLTRHRFWAVGVSIKCLLFVLM